PSAAAKFKLPVFCAEAFLPAAMAPLKSPFELAVVPSPSPIAKLVGVLVQPPLLPTPLIDAHVAAAVPALPSAAVASAPEAAATSNIPPASRCFDGVLCSVIGVLLLKSSRAPHPGVGGNLQ